MLKSNLSADVSGPNLLFFFVIFKLLNRIAIHVDLIIYIHKFNKLSVWSLHYLGIAKLNSYAG